MRRRLILRWAAVTLLTGLIAGGLLAYAYSWKEKQAAAFETLSKEFQEKSVLIQQSKELRARRLDLAARMQKMQELMDDRTLLSLLRNVSDGFSSSDCLEYVSIEAHSTAPSRDGKDTGEEKYQVRINGVTANDTTHADLLNRLTEIGAKANPPIMITPESLKREKCLDGQVMRFQILCEKPKPKNG
jgi:hypothetical protein